jgi:hypothetical protein
VIIENLEIPDADGPNSGDTKMKEKFFELLVFGT